MSNALSFDTATANPTPPNQVTALAFNESSGTTCADSSGSGHTGTLVNGPTRTPGKFGNGLTLDGTNDYVSVANPSTLNLGTSNFTIALWIKRQATGVEHTVLSKTGDASWTTGGKELFVSGSDNRLNLGCFGVGEVSSTGTITNDGLWHHVAVTFVDSSNTVAFFIDGVASGGGTLNLPADVASHVVKVGGHPAGHYFRGEVDEFRIFSRALSSGEVQSIMNNAILSGPDTTPPVRSNGQPSGTLPLGTTQATLSLTTNENATSRYSPSPGTAYAAMPGTFTTTGGTSHSTTVTGLTNGSSYTYYVRSIDASGNANTDDFAISFSIALSDTTPPVRSNGQPSGTLPAGTTQATLSLTTNENATSRYSPSPGTAYAAMLGTFTTTGGTNHSTTITGLTNGSSYTYYVRSIDTSGNANTTDFPISFSIASQPTGTPRESSDRARLQREQRHDMRR